MTVTGDFLTNLIHDRYWRLSKREINTDGCEQATRVSYKTSTHSRLYCRDREKK